MFGKVRSSAFLNDPPRPCAALFDVARTLVRDGKPIVIPNWRIFIVQIDSSGMCQESSFSARSRRSLPFDSHLSILICTGDRPRKSSLLYPLCFLLHRQRCSGMYVMVRLVYPIESETTRKTRKLTSTMWSSLKGAEAIFGCASVQAIGSAGPDCAHVGRTGERSR